MGARPVIYGRCGQPITVLRRGTLADVKNLDGRKPDKQDREAVRNGSYVVVLDDGKERLYHQCYMRADGGSREIADALEAVDGCRCPDCDVCRDAGCTAAAACRAGS